MRNSLYSYQLKFVDSFRLAQYTAKFLKWYWTEHEVDKRLVTKCLNLESSLGLTRKAIRIGKSLDMIQGAVNSLKVENKFIRMCLLLTKLSMSGYLFIDHFIWASKLELISTDSKRLARSAAWFWLVAILAGLARNFYDIVVILQAELRRRAKLRQQSRSKGFGRTDAVESARHTHPCGLMVRLMAEKPLMIDTVKNAADVFLPLATLELFKTSEGFQGLMGMVSSYMGLLATWNPALKLIPG